MESKERKDDWGINLTYTKEDLSSILEDLINYLEDTDDSSYDRYFQEIVKTGLFQDACGKIISNKNGVVITTTDY